MVTALANSHIHRRIKKWTPLVDGRPRITNCLAIHLLDRQFVIRITYEEVANS